MSELFTQKSRSMQHMFMQHVQLRATAHQCLCETALCFPCDSVSRCLACFLDIYILDMDTLSQRNANLQSLEKCLDYRDIASVAVCSQAKVVLGCAMHRHASRRESKVADSEAASTTVMSSVADCQDEADTPNSRPRAQAQLVAIGNACRAY